jgi:hypothetical protein
VVGHEEPVQVKIEAVLDGGAVDFGNQTARAGEFDAVETDAFAEQAQFIRCLSRMLAPAAADVDTEVHPTAVAARALGRRLRWL